MATYYSMDQIPWSYFCKMSSIEYFCQYILNSDQPLIFLSSNKPHYLETMLKILTNQFHFNLFRDESPIQYSIKLLTILTVGFREENVERIL